jgi:hypothetical protein
MLFPPAGENSLVLMAHFKPHYARLVNYMLVFRLISSEVLLLTSNRHTKTERCHSLEIRSLPLIGSGGQERQDGARSCTLIEGIVPTCGSIG